MKKMLLAIIVASGVALTLFAKLDLIPMPREVKVSDGECRAVDAPRVEIAATIPPEGYELSITPDGVTIRHSDDAGLFYAQMTLKQLLDGAADGALPCVEIKDAPAFRWRGVHLDEARHFFGKTAVKRILDEMSWYKLNVFHCHLTDSQAWVLDVPGYPKLVRQGLGKNFGERSGRSTIRRTTSAKSSTMRRRVTSRSCQRWSSQGISVRRFAPTRNWAVPVAGR